MVPDQDMPDKQTQKDSQDLAMKFVENLTAVIFRIPQDILNPMLIWCKMFTQLYLFKY